MKDIEEFQKIFKVNFPVTEHYQYYLDTMMKSEFYAGVGVLVKEYEQYERDVEELGYKSAKSYKLDYALPLLKNFILASEPFKNMMDWKMPDKPRTKDTLKSNGDTYLISIDFKSANYNALRTFDSFGVLGDSWEGFCMSMDIHPTLSKSKSFRQFVFGNTNPKRLQRRQHTNIAKIVDKLIEDHGFEEDDFIFISHDEFIVRLRPDHALAVGRVSILLTAVGNIIESESIDMPTHYKALKNSTIVKGGKPLKQARIQTHYQVKMGGLSEKYETLYSVPGDKFFKYFKEYILKEPFDKRDLMFMSNGDIAVWDEGDDSIAEMIYPEGELSYTELEEQYPDLIKKLRNEVDGLNEPQVRKIANIALEFSYKGY
jgi:hypothetical protein